MCCEEGACQKSELVPSARDVGTPPFEKHPGLRLGAVDEGSGLQMDGELTEEVRLDPKFRDALSEKLRVEWGAQSMLRLTCIDFLLLCCDHMMPYMD